MRRKYGGFIVKKITTAKRITAVLLALVLCFSLTATAFAAEMSLNNAENGNHGVTFCEINSETGEVLGENGSIMPREMQYLTGMEDFTFDMDQSRSFTVTPNKGWNLKIIISLPTNGVTVTVKKQGSLFNTTKLTIPTGGATHYDLVNNCNGGAYVVTVSGTGARVIMQLVQTQYA